MHRLGREFLPRGAVSRREVLRAAAGALVAGGFGCAAAQDRDAELRARARSLLDTTLSVDIHSHAGGVLSRNLKTNDVAASMHAGRLSAICLSLVSDSPVLDRANGKFYATREPNPGELRAHVLRRMDLADRVIADSGAARILTLADLRAAKAKDAPGVILAVEGSDFLDGKLEALQPAYDRGIRHWQLVHYRAANGLGDIQTEQPGYRGATSFGLDVVRACNRLGIVVDVAHATFATVKQVAEVATAPLALSHTAFTSTLRFQSRLIDAEHARLVAATGGVIGVWTSGATFSGFAAYAEGVARLAQVVGVEHVAIGTDLNGVPTPMFKSYVDFPEFTAALFKHFNDDEVRKIVGGNYLRVFDKVTRPGTAA